MPGLLISGHSRGRSLAAEEALATIDRAALCRFERHRGFAAALRTRGHGFGFGKAPAAATLAFLFAGLAALGLVLEILVVEEVLFSCCEDKIGSTVHAL